MDMKKKLQETYTPDQEARKRRMVVGLSGGLNSSVTAYLLKIQKFDLVGVTVVLNWEAPQVDGTNANFCHLNHQQLDGIKEFCHQLGIPHMVIKASDEFKELVVEQWVNSRATGSKSNACWSCHELRMEILYRKMLELEAEGIATGHMAKLFKIESHHSVYVHSSNDEINDQSSYLARLPRHILERLLLPLSDLQQKEILKLAENFGINGIEKKTPFLTCFEHSPSAGKFLSEFLPARYQQSGEIIDHEGAPMGEHQGVFQYSYGGLVPVNKQTQNDPFKLARYHFKEKRIELSKGDYFIRKSFLLNQCKRTDETPWYEPLRGVLKLTENQFVDCLIYPKNLESAFIELESAQFVPEGAIVSILKKKGKNSKVYLTGKVRYIHQDDQHEEDSERPKVDFSRDY